MILEALISTHRIAKRNFCFRVGYFQGDIKLLLDDVSVLQPTFFPMVPRLINRMYDKVYNVDDL